MDLLRTLVSGDLKRLNNDEWNLNLTYITPQIVAMSYPATSFIESSYRNDIRTVAAYLEAKHKDHYMVFNLSQRPYDNTIFNGRVLEFGWPDHHAPPLMFFFDTVKSVDAWLKSDDRNVAVIHCLAGRGRTGIIICGWLLYSGQFSTMKEALEYYANARSAKKQGVTQPSQLRYARYLDAIITKQFVPKPRTIKINKIIIKPLTALAPSGFLRPMLKLFRFTPVTDLELWSSHTATTTVAEYNTSVHPEIVFDMGGIVARGDLMIKLFSVTDLWLTQKVDCIARLIFHTGFVGPNTASLTFRKHDIDVLEKNKSVSRDLEFQICFEVDSDASLEGVDAGLWDQDRFDKFQRVAQDNRNKAIPYSSEIIPPKIMASSSSSAAGSQEAGAPKRSESPSLSGAIREDHIASNEPVVQVSSSSSSESSAVAPTVDQAAFAASDAIANGDVNLDDSPQSPDVSSPGSRNQKQPTEADEQDD